MGKLYNGFQKLINITMRVFAFLKAKDKLTHKECEEKAKIYLISKAQREEPFIQTDPQIIIDRRFIKRRVIERTIIENLNWRLLSKLIKL